MSLVSKVNDSEGSMRLESSALQAPPMVLIPGKQIPKHIIKLKVMEPSTVPLTPVVDDKASNEEKIGRWTELEHKVFLDGLSTHGKQWKTISNMIGTRTVVQVRTHAQKYFQKLERKNKTKALSVPQPSIAHTKPSKRKSLPSSMPSRKKAKTSPVLSKPVVSLTASLSKVSVNHQSPSDLHAFVSTSSLSSGNWSTDSPTGVHELDLQLSASAEEPKEEELLLEEAFTGPETASTEDPLDWLIDGGFGHLPESSLGQPPLFPDFSDLSADTHVLEAQAKTTEEQHNSFDTSVLQDIADPKVTVQSLFLDEGDEHFLEA